MWVPASCSAVKFAYGRSDRAVGINSVCKLRPASNENRNEFAPVPPAQVVVIDSPNAEWVSMVNTTPRMPTLFDSSSTYLSITNGLFDANVVNNSQN